MDGQRQKMKGGFDGQEEEERRREGQRLSAVEYSPE